MGAMPRCEFSLPGVNRRGARPRSPHRPHDSAHLLLVWKANHLNFGQNFFNAIRGHGGLSFSVGVGKRDAPTLGVAAGDRLHHLPNQHRHRDEVDIGSDFVWVFEKYGSLSQWIF